MARRPEVEGERRPTGSDTSEGATAGGGAASGTGTAAGGERRPVGERWPAWERPSRPCDTAPPVLQLLEEMGDWGCWVRDWGLGWGGSRDLETWSGLDWGVKP